MDIRPWVALSAVALELWYNVVVYWTAVSREWTKPQNCFGALANLQWVRSEMVAPDRFIVRMNWILFAVWVFLFGCYSNSCWQRSIRRSVRRGTVLVVNKTHEAETWTTSFVNFSFSFSAHYGQHQRSYQRQCRQVTASDKRLIVLRTFLR